MLVSGCIQGEVGFPPACESGRRMDFCLARWHKEERRWMTFKVPSDFQDVGLVISDADDYGCIHNPNHN